MTSNDREYFRKRAAIERALAQSASDPRIADIHHELAERYEALVGDSKRPTLLILSDRLSRAA